jgi:putative ABC transport system permease protein
MFRAVLAELLLIGVGAGIAGAALSAVLARLLHVDLPVPRILAVVPVGLAVMLVTGVAPALAAARMMPLRALRPPAVVPRRARPVSSIVGMALVDLSRHPLRTARGMLGLAVGVGAMTVLLTIHVAFRGLLTGTLLGDALTVQVGTVDYVAAGILVLVGAASVGNELHLSLSSREQELVTLRTLGWERRHLHRLVAWQSAALSIGAAGAGMAGGVAVAAAVTGGAWPEALGFASVTAVGGSMLALVAGLLSARAVMDLPPPSVLAGD